MLQRAGDHIAGPNVEYDLTLNGLLPTVRRRRVARFEEMQKPDANGYDRVESAAEQTFRLQAPALVLFRLVRVARDDDPEVEALLVLERRRAIGIQEIPLVEHGVGNVLDHPRVHFGTSSSSAVTIRSTTASHDGIPCCCLYRESRSNASRRIASQLVLG